MSVISEALFFGNLLGFVVILELSSWLVYSTRFQRQQEEIERISGDSEVCVAQKEISEKAEKIFLLNLFRQSFLPMRELFFGKVRL